MKTRILTMLMAVCLILALFVGCSDNGADSTPTAGSNTEAPNPSSDVNQTSDPGAEDEAKYGGDLVLAATSLPTDFFTPGASAKGNWIYLCPALEPLGIQQTDGSWSPHLAESWEADAENNTFTIKLKEGIKFHDGSDFNADALVKIFDMYFDEGGQANICSPTSYEASDDYTVVMYFDSFMNTWVETISQVHVLSPTALEENGKDYLSTNAIGTGPFIQTEFIAGNSLKFVKNEDYWMEGLPYLDSIEFVVMSDTNTQVSSLTNGEIHGVQVSSGSIVAQLSANDSLKDISKLTPATASFFYIGVNSADENSPFADVRVRQAAMYAIDRDASAAALTEGLGMGVNQICVEGSYGYIEAPNAYEYDVEKAKELLTEAGYPNGFDTTIYVNSNFEMQAVALKSYLDAAGINSEISMQDSATFTETTVNSSFQHVAINAGSVASYDPATYYGRIFGPERTRWKGSMTEFTDAHELLAKTMSAPTFEEQCEYLGQIYTFVNEELPHLPWYTYAASYFTADNLYGTGMDEVQAFQWTPHLAYFAD